MFKLLVPFSCVALLLSGAKISYATENTLTIISSSHVVSLQIEIADSPISRRNGLMHRISLPTNAAMLFDYKENKKVSMWMKNTLIALDMLFIDKHGIIKKIHQRAEPFSLEKIDSDHVVRAVLEMNAGLIKKYNIQPGNKICHEMFLLPHESASD